MAVLLLHPYLHSLQYYCIFFCKLMHKPVCDDVILHWSLLGSPVKYFTVSKNRHLMMSGWKMIPALQSCSNNTGTKSAEESPAFLLSRLSGALLCAMHKAQRDEVSGAVWWRSLPAPGGLPRPDGECDGAEGWLCLQAALRSLPAAVSEHDALWSKTSSVFQFFLS